MITGGDRKMVSCLREESVLRAGGCVDLYVFYYVKREGLDSAEAVKMIPGREEHGNVEVFGRV